MNLDEKEKKFNKVINAIKIFAVAKHLMYNQSCAENLNLERFKTIKSCCNVLDLLKMEVIWVLNRKPTICRYRAATCFFIIFPGF